jgi:hypothetical protein
MNAAKCQNACKMCGFMFVYHTSRHIFRDVCDACLGPALALAPESVKPGTTAARTTGSSISDEEFILAWNMCDTMDDLLDLLPEYDCDLGKGRGRARNRGYLLRKDGHDLKMMRK